MRTPITYYGGKQKLIKALLPLLPEHRQYVEPFVGGGALFFSKEPSKAEIINDLNGNVINFYRVVQIQFTELRVLIDGTLHSRATYQEAIEIYHNPAGHDTIKRAWAFWVVTNDGFSGKIGSWAVEKKDNKVGRTLANKREQFTKEYAKRLQYVQIENKDAIEIIKQYDRESVFFYLDPPYFNSNCGHYKGYTESDYKKLLDTLVNIKGKFLLSSYPSDILGLYAKEYGWNYKEITQRIAVTHLSRKQKIEALAWNYGMPSQSTKPEIENYKLSLLAAVQKFSDKCKQIDGKKVAMPRKNTSPGNLVVPEPVSNFVLEKECPDEKKRLSLDYCKRVLEKSGKKYTDEEVLRIRQLLYRVGNLEYQLFTELKTKQDGKHNSLRKGKHRRTSSQRDKYPLSKGKTGAVL